MRKFFTLTMMALLLGIGSTQAQTLRKTWDFRNGFSSKTINALKADQEEFGPDKYWRNYEGDATKADEQHFWNASKDAKNADGYACTHNGGIEKVIPELEGLVLGMSNAKKFVITYDGAQAANEFESEGGPALGEMIPHGKSYIWLNGKNETIKFDAAVNQTIKIGIESHAVNRTKLGEARGISLSSSAGVLTLKEGNAVPTYYTECVWDLEGGDGEVASLTIKTTNGCHIYYIIVGEGDDPNANKTTVGYLTDGDATAEEAYNTLLANENYIVTPISAAAVASPETLAANKVTVVSPDLKADNAAVGVLKQAIAFYPIVNLNASLYTAWGLGEAVASSMGAGMFTNLKHSLFADLIPDADYSPVDEGIYALPLTNDETFTGVKLGDYFAADDVVLTDGMNPEIVAIHAHNINQNGYFFMPFRNATDAARKLLDNLVGAASSSKSEITKAPAPKIIFEYKNQLTRVAMAMPSANYKMAKIFYTTDGTDPTEASAVYTDTMIVTQPTTFKAVAIADGYLLSEVAESTAEIYSQPATPTVDMAFEDGVTTVSLTCATEGADIWYNFTESTDTAQSMKYAEPFGVTAPATLTAFAVTGGMVFSELATQRVTVKNPIVRLDQMALFDANAADYQNGGGSTVYYFSWGKNARSIYDTEAEPVSTTEDPETGDSIVVYPEFDYSIYVPVDSVTNPDAKVYGNWQIMSKGQVMIWQSLSAGNDPGNLGGYNPDTAGDILPYAKITNNDIQFGGKISGERCTGAIQSRVKFQAPFDVVTHVGTAAGGDNVGKMLVEVSADSLNWTAVGDTMTTSTVKRLWKSYTRSYNGSDEVYVRITQAGGGSSVQIYDIYLMNEGEQSIAKKEEYEREFNEQQSGIELFKSKVAAPAVYSLNGLRLNGLHRGLNIVRHADGSTRKIMVK